MEYGGASLDPEVREALGRSWKAVMAIGVILIFVGCVAILVPAVASVGTAIFIGWLLVILSAFLCAAAFVFVLDCRRERSSRPACDRGGPGQERSPPGRVSVERPPRDEFT